MSGKPYIDTDYSPAPHQDGMMPLDTHAGSVQTTHPGVVELTDIITPLAASSANSEEAAPAGAGIGRATIPFPTFQGLSAGHSAATSSSIAPETAADPLDDPANPLTIYMNNPLTEKMYRNSTFVEKGISFNVASVVHQLQDSTIKFFRDSQNAPTPENKKAMEDCLIFLAQNIADPVDRLHLKFAILIEKDIRDGVTPPPAPAPAPAPKKTCAIL